ncbi:MAG: replication restart helicase PriA [Lacipirellulaceae bacterium]
MSRQQSLFDTAPAEWELAAAARALLATVVFPKGPPGEFDYTVPDAMADERHRDALAEPGRRVRAPLGRGGRLETGYCVAVGQKDVPAGRSLKELAAVTDSASLVSPSLLRLARWMAARYLTPLGQVLEAIVPQGVRGGAGTREVTMLRAPTRVAARWGTLELPPKQRAALSALVNAPGPLSVRQVIERAGCTTAPVAALRKAGLVESWVERREHDPAEEAPPLGPSTPRAEAKRLNEDQSATLGAILEAVNAPRHETILVHGVTGSGKTEVYLQAIERVVSFGRQAIVLVPEISLTPQTVGRFRERFDRVAVQHSHQTPGERHRQWRQIAAGGAQVVVGARSAVFAPTPHLGLVVIDEEHESSFKQETAPRYHARDVAIERTRAEGVPLVLASATPALESWVRAQPAAALAAKGLAEPPPGERFRLAEMPRRIENRPMPGVRVVDLRTESIPGFRGAISRQLNQAMDEALRDGGQVILLLNRRGHSPHLQCPRCGEVVKCRDCDVSLTFHRTEEVAVCHWCDFRSAPPTACPNPKCGSPAVRYGGMGTQKLEAEVRARFPNVAVVRMDADTMRGPGSHERALDAFRRGETRVLLGTQMIAKGLDFPDVTLVGVVSADAALHLPDFRAAERTFQLVTQVAGRTGRGERGGRVVVQALDPDHPAIRAAANHDYAAFARQELAQRAVMGRPPYGSAVRLIARGKNPKLVEAFLAALADDLRSRAAAAGVAVRLLGPAEAPIARIREEHRQHVQLYAPDAAGLHAVVDAAWSAAKPPEGVRAIVDIDPIDML